MQEVLLTKFLTVSNFYVGEEFLNKINIDPVLIAQKVYNEIFDGVKTSKLDELASKTALPIF